MISLAALCLGLYFIPKWLVMLLGGFPAGKESFRSLRILAALAPLAYLEIDLIFVAVWGEPSFRQEVGLNFLQHFLGGGVACGLVSIYLIKNFLINSFGLQLKFSQSSSYNLKVDSKTKSDTKLRLSPGQWFLISGLIFFSVASVFGVANELMEFLLDLLTQKQYSRDRWDTWIDFLANSSGAALIWLIYFFSSVKQNPKSKIKPGQESSSKKSTR